MNFLKLYLCTERETNDDETFKDFFKWGITTRKTAKARSVYYVETHRFVETPLAKQAEQAINAIVYYLSPEYEYKCGQNRTLLTERVSADFPLDVLCEIWDYVADLAVACGDNSAKFEKLILNFKTENCFDTVWELGYQILPIPAFNNPLLQRWRQKLVKSIYWQPSVTSPEPMWS